MGKIPEQGHDERCEESICSLSFHRLGLGPGSSCAGNGVGHGTTEAQIEGPNRQAAVVARVEMDHAHRGSI